ncbi:MAG: peptidase M20, partial [Gammaproteobacteria bacterium]|nr:peptidase M20 [Gammaproteobacteria bacterium]
MTLETGKLFAFIDNCWNTSIIPALTNYIRIPNKSPAFDANWEKNGHMAHAAQLISDWCHNLDVAGMTLEVLQLPHRTPLIYIEIAGQQEETVLLYGHFDKQPEMTGWHPGLSPWGPVIEDDKL